MENLFIKLTTFNGKTINVNFNKVFYYSAMEVGTFIVDGSDNNIKVKEPVEFIDQFINPNGKRKMKFKDAPIGSRFSFTDSNDIYIKIHSEGDGLVVIWNGSVEGRQSHCCWIDDETDFDTEIEVF